MPFFITSRLMVVREKTWRGGRGRNHSPGGAHWRVGGHPRHIHDDVGTDPAWLGWIRLFRRLLGVGARRSPLTEHQQSRRRDCESSLRDQEGYTSRCLRFWSLPPLAMADGVSEPDPHCASCGYCLTGAPGPLCPECGCEIEYNLVVGRPLLSRTWQTVIESTIRIVIVVAIAGTLLVMLMV